MKVKDLIMKLIYCDPEAEVRCVTYENENEDADEFALNIRTLEDYEDNVDLVLDNLNVGRVNEDQIFKILRNKVLDWAKDKDLLHEENAEKQFMKFVEEVFEFKSEMDYLTRIGQSSEEVYSDYEQIEAQENMELEMGDIFVTLIILCKQIGINPESCLEMAYKKIKDRQGRTINGTFIKSEDLWWMQRCLLIPYKTFRDKIKIVNYYERRGYYIEVWEGYIYCYRGK